MTLSNKSFKIASMLIPIASVGVAGSAAILPNTIWLKKMKAVVHSYKNGLPVPVPPQIHELLVEIKSDLAEAKSLEDYDVTPEKLNNIKPFTVFGFDMYRLGWLEYGFEGILGIPEYFAHNKDDTIPKTGIKVKNEPVEWDSEGGKELMQSFHNSKDAKKFAIAREMLLLCKDDVTLKTSINSWNVFLATSLMLGVTDVLKLKEKPKIVGLIIYSMIVTTTVALYIFMKDFSTNSREKEVDDALCSLGMNYCIGGTEFYYNTIRRNIALRKLMGTEGERVYTAYGNEQSLIRQRHVPVVDRAEACRNHLQAYIDEKKAKDPEPEKS